MNVTSSFRLAAACLLLALGACGGGGSGDEDGGTTPPPPPPQTGIGPAGGTVVGPNGAKVEIPAGALAANTPIAIQQISPTSATPLPAGSLQVGSMFEFTPHGTTFAVPVTITLPFDPAAVPASTEPQYFKTNAQNQWEHVTSAVFGTSTVTAQVTSFSGHVIVGGLRRNDPTRFWLFILDDLTQIIEPPPQTGGKVEDIRNFGPEVFDIDGDGDQTMEVFSSADGVTFWVNAEDRGLADLTQTQSFVKEAAGATLEFVITAATLEAIDLNGVPDDSECPRGKDLVNCRPMYAHVQYIGRAISGDGRLLLDEKGVPLFDARGFAQLLGRTGLWAFKTGELSVFSTALAWTEAAFTFTTSAGGGSNQEHPKAALIEPLVLKVDLTSVPVGEEFYVQSSVLAFATGRRKEDGIGAYLRDPARVGGAVMNFSGLRPTNKPLPAAPPVGIGPPEPCATGPDPAAGVLQFSAATYTMIEAPFVGLSGIQVTRTQGSTGPVSATFTAGGGTATPGVHYTPLSVTVRFSDGDTTPRTVPLDILINTDNEPDKTVNLTLSEPGGCATLGAQQSAILTILDDDRPPPERFTVGGTVTGLTGTGLVLENHTGLFVEITGNGPFTFSQLPSPPGTSYFVRVFNQPRNALGFQTQECTVANGSGVFGSANVTNVIVTCEDI